MIFKPLHSPLAADGLFMLPALHSVHSILVFPASYAHLVPSLQLVHSEINKNIISFVQQ